MKRVKAKHSFASNGLSFYPGLETEVEDNFANDWAGAGLVEIVGENVEDKELTADEIERQNLEAMAKQLGLEVKEELTNDELEDLIQGAIAAKKEAKLAQAQGQEAPQDENSKEKKPNPTKPRQVTDAGEKVE